MESDGEYGAIWYGGTDPWLFPGYRGWRSHPHGPALGKATGPPGAGLVYGPCGNRAWLAGIGEKDGSTGVRLS